MTNNQLGHHILMMDTNFEICAFSSGTRECKNSHGDGAGIGTH